MFTLHLVFILCWTQLCLMGFHWLDSNSILETIDLLLKKKKKGKNVWHLLFIYLFSFFVARG